MIQKELFKGIEQTGENYIFELKRLAEKAQKAILSQINSIKFEAIYNLSVSKEQREKTMLEVKEVRKELWKQALEKAGGDVKNAFSFYEQLCESP